MKAVAALVGLALVALAISGTVDALDSEYYGSPQQHTDNSLCRSIQLCHSNKELAYSSLDIFSALEGLFLHLHLPESTVTDYVEVTQFEGCINKQCCCSRPIQITVRLPHLAANAIGTLEQYLEQQLPQQLRGLICSGEVEQCHKDEVSTQRRRNLLDVTADDVKVVWSEEVDGVEFQAVRPVPDMPTGFTSPVYMRQNAGEEAGIGYGSYGEPQAGNYGYGSYSGERAGAEAQIELGALSLTGRSLLAQAEKQQQPIKPAVPSGKGSKTGKEKAGGDSKGSTSNSSKADACPPCPSCSKSPSNSTKNGCEKAQQMQGIAAGSCYCRYNTRSASWALEESACRAALKARCSPAGSSRNADNMLECEHVDAFYNSLVRAGGGLDSPHGDAISTFLYVDCPPAPPCSCKALALAGASKDTKSLREQCCADLKAHCQVPFSGLDCADTVRFCSKTSSADEETIYSFALVKTHSIDCTKQQFAAAYTSTTPSALTASHEEVAAMFAIKEQEIAHEMNMAAGLTVMTTVVASCVAAGMAAFGVVTLVRQHAARKCISPITSYGNGGWSHWK